MAGSWHSLYIPSGDGVAIEAALERALLQQGYKRYDPFPGGSGLTAHIWQRRVRQFVAPPVDGWTRVIGEPDRAALPDLAAMLGASLLEAWLSEAESGLAVWGPEGPAADVRAALAGWLRPDRTPDDLARALAGQAPVTTLAAEGPQVLAVPLPPDVARMAEEVDPAQAGKIDAWLDGKSHTWLKDQCIFCEDIGCFMFFHPNAVPGAVSKVFAVAGVGNDVAGCTIHISRRDAGPGSGAPGGICFHNGVGNPV